MTNPADTKKGAIPLDANVTASGAGQAEASQEQIPSQPDSWAELVEQMGITLGYLYHEVKGGRVKALSCVFVDDSDVPQHAYFVAPNAAVPLLAGMMVGTDDVKIGAHKSMEGYKNWLRQRAEEAAKQHSEPGKGEQALN